MSRAYQFFTDRGLDAPAGAIPVSASGTTITYADGQRVRCLTSGLWNTNLGYGVPQIADAIAAAARDASYLTLFRGTHAYAEEAAEVLCALPARPFARAVFATSGSAALDLALKTARLAAATHSPGRSLVVSLRGGYHGMTYGATSLSDEDFAHVATGIDRRAVRHVAVDDGAEFAALLRVAGQRVAAVVIEPVQGSGTRVVPPELIAAILAGRRVHGYLVVADEVATGFGRTGPMFASDLWPAAPDLLVTSKGLTNGTCAAAAVLLSEHVGATLQGSGAVIPFGETQAGAPTSCAAILATARAFTGRDALARGRALADRLEAGLGELVARTGDSPAPVAAVGLSGAGCFRSVLLADRAGDPGGAADSDRPKPVTQDTVMSVVHRAQAAGIRVHPGPSCVQVIPALTMQPCELDDALEVLSSVLGSAPRRRGPHRPGSRRPPVPAEPVGSGAPTGRG